MMLYRLYVESGPMRKKTMVHVLDLMGCIANGPTTEIALERTPRAIQAYLRLLRRHGESVDPDAPFTTEIAEHVTEGSWLGNGDPSLVFPTDLEPLTPEDIETYARRLEWSRAEVLALVEGLSEQRWVEKPQPIGRSIRAILEHIFGAEYAYMRSFGKLEGISGPGAPERMQKEELIEWMGDVRAFELKRLRSLSEEERSAPFVRGKQTRTRIARKVLRRMLEHEWEHLVELSECLGKPL
jgi:uncharacterized damage-inducible protein DinB/predicted RNase H-like HicB family nuclease